MFFAAAAIFAHHQFFGRVDFIPVGYVVLALAHGADECQ